MLQTQHASLVAGTARLDALAYPHFFLRQHLVELGIHHRLVAQHAFLDRLIRGEISRETRQLAAIQFDDAGGDVVQKTPVVGDEQHAADKIVEQAFQPFDGGEVQMVGRLVEDQHIRLGHQGLRQGHALALPPGQVADALVRLQIQLGDGGLDARLHRPAVLRFELRLQVLHLFQQLVEIRVRLGKLMRHTMIIVQQLLQLAQPFRDCIEHRVIGIQHRFLTDEADTRGRRAPYQPVIQRALSSEHAHHAGLAAAVAPDQADALALIELKIGMIQQGNVPECKAGLVQSDEWHGGLLLLRYGRLIQEGKSHHPQRHRPVAKRIGEAVQQ